MLVAALQRPSLHEAAARADRAFAGHAVMTTALECLTGRQAAGTDAAGIVLRQAGRAAADWRPLLRRQPGYGTNGYTAAAIIPAFVGILLLSQPGAERPAPSSGDPPLVPLRQDAAGIDAAAVRDAVANLRQEIAGSRSPGGETGESASPGQRPAPHPGDERSAGPLVTTPPDRLRNLANAPGRDSHEAVGDAAARRRRGHPSRSSTLHRHRHRHCARWRWCCSQHGNTPPFRIIRSGTGLYPGPRAPGRAAGVRIGTGHTDPFPGRLRRPLPG